MKLIFYTVSLKICVLEVDYRRLMITIGLVAIFAKLFSICVFVGK